MADFVHADLRGSRFERVDLSGAQFRGVDLSGAVLRGVELTGADIYGEIGGSPGPRPWARRWTWPGRLSSRRGRLCWR